MDAAAMKGASSLGFYKLRDPSQQTKEIFSLFKDQYLLQGYRDTY